jgi:hypothetical protein
MPGAGASKLHVFTARLPMEEYETLRQVSALLGLSVNETVRRAVLAFLKDEVGDEKFDMLVEQARDRFRRTLERLGDA